MQCMNDNRMNRCSENGEPLEEQFLNFMQHLQSLSEGQVPNHRYLQDLLWEVACGGQADKTDRETKEAMLETVCYDWCTEDCVHKNPAPAAEISDEDANAPLCNCVCRALPKTQHGLQVQISRGTQPESDEDCTSNESAGQSTDQSEEHAVPGADNRALPEPTSTVQAA